MSLLLDFRAATNKEVREKVTIELGFVKSKLEVLRNDLAQLNSSVKIYQNEKSVSTDPHLVSAVLFSYCSCCAVCSEFMFTIFIVLLLVIVELRL